MLTIFLFILLLSIVSSRFILKSLKFYDVLFCLLFSITIFTGTINPAYEIGINYPSLFIVLVLIISFISISFQKENREDLFAYFDKLALFFIVFGVLLPYLFNSIYVKDINKSHVFGYFIFIKIWFTYRVYIFILNKKYFDFYKLYNTIFFISSISCIISLLAYFNISPVAEFYTKTWPLQHGAEGRSLEAWGRLTGTMSGTNGTGSFYAILALLSLFCYLKKSNKIYLICVGLFFVSTILSGSLSSIGAFIIIAIIILKKTITKNFFKVFALVVSVALFAIIINESFNPALTMVKKRLDFVDNTRRHATNDVLPNEINQLLPINIVARIGYWDNFIKIITASPRSALFGMGPGGTRNSNTINHGVPESFYFRIINETGFLGLICFIIFYKKLYSRTIYLRKQKKNVETKDQIYLFSFLLIFFLISGIANETLYYGGNCELFSLFVAQIFSTKKFNSR